MNACSLITNVFINMGKKQVTEIYGRLFIKQKRKLNISDTHFIKKIHR